MGADTLLLEWRGLKEQLDTCNVKQQESAWIILKEHEEYMESKGFIINFNSILSPQGEIVWERI